MGSPSYIRSAIRTSVCVAASLAVVELSADRSGVGAAVSGDTVYVTQLFATDLGLPKHKPGQKPRPAMISPSAPRLL